MPYIKFFLFSITGLVLLIAGGLLTGLDFSGMIPAGVSGLTIFICILLNVCLGVYLLIKNYLTWQEFYSEAFHGKFSPGPEMMLEIMRHAIVQKKAILKLENDIEEDKKIDNAMAKYFDALYSELLKMADQKEKELKKDKFIDRVMEAIYDNIHVALHDIVMEKTNNLEEAQNTIRKYEIYIKDIIHEKTKKLNEENEKLRELAITDELTGLCNRRGFTLLTREKINESVKEKQKVSLLFIDVDNFKGINDTFGHDEGDYLLKQTSLILCRSLRGDDIICRYGGDEFVVFMQAVDTDAVISRIEQNCERFNRDSSKVYKLSLSVGSCSIFPDSQNVIEHMIREADNKMYFNKSIRKK